MSVTDGLPAPDTKWTPRRKAQVVEAVLGSLLDLEEACDRYALTVEEFLSWQAAIDRDGIIGLTRRSLEERRRASRRTVNEAGQIVSAKARFDCFIANISPGGARLELATPAAVPEGFELRCLRTERSVWVRAAWRKKEALGVCFETALPLPLMDDSRLGEWLLGDL